MSADYLLCFGFCRFAQQQHQTHWSVIVGFLLGPFLKTGVNFVTLCSASTKVSWSDTSHTAISLAVIYSNFFRLSVVKKPSLMLAQMQTIFPVLLLHYIYLTFFYKLVICHHIIFFGRPLATAFSFLFFSFNKLVFKIFQSAKLWDLLSPSPVQTLLFFSPVSLPDSCA